MINRILIRIKVVQMLYSYLLTRSEFKIDSAPETASRDKRFAYAVYLDFLLLILELSGYPVKNHTKVLPLCDIDKKLASNKMAKALSVNDTVRSTILKGNTRIGDFDNVVQGLHDRIVASSSYRDYKKKKSPELSDDVAFWTTILSSLIAKDEKVVEVARRNPDFTIYGFNKGIGQLIDTLKNYSDTKQTLVNARKDLAASLDKAYELYHGVFVLMIELTKEQERRLENAKAKYLATAEELNPDTRFIDNALVATLSGHPGLKAYLNDHPISWEGDVSLIKVLLDKILQSDIYSDYMSKDVSDFETDCEFWRKVLRLIIFPSDELAEALEARSVYWNDDLQIMGTFVLKTIKQISSARGEGVSLLPQYKDDEDASFGQDLFMYAVNNRETYREYIDNFINSEQWDPERLAFMDIVIMITALAELINYPAIPIPVTMNEYIEIANSYSTAKSGQFINGILFSVIKYLKSEGIINKN